MGERSSLIGSFWGAGREGTDTQPPLCKEVGTRGEYWKEEGGDNNPGFTLDMFVYTFSYYTTYYINKYFVLAILRCLPVKILHIS